MTTNTAKMCSNPYGKDPHPKGDSSSYSYCKPCLAQYYRNYRANQKQGSADVAAPQTITATTPELSESRRSHLIASNGKAGTCEACDEFTPRLKYIQRVERSRNLTREEALELLEGFIPFALLCQSCYEAVCSILPDQWNKFAKLHTFFVKTGVHRSEVIQPFPEPFDKF